MKFEWHDVNSVRAKNLLKVAVKISVGHMEMLKFPAQKDVNRSSEEGCDKNESFSFRNVISLLLLHVSLDFFLIQFTHKFFSSHEPWGCASLIVLH